MRELGWSDGRLAEEAGLSFNTVAEFLAGKRDWPRSSTRRAIEGALGWAPGALERIASGSERGVLGPDRSPDPLPVLG
jgi:transcriptional regulator with XRE-family HTH domain